ncbi:MAG: GDP-mannose 4,6-dehydratase [Caldilineaceae bacterium]|nr:GDP-mannose 4,6-dehydratase [Caldilineaceae bacterium]
MLGTVEGHSVREFLDEAFGPSTWLRTSYVGLDWQEYVRIDPRYYRPTEVDYLLADASQAKQTLDWQPWVRFAELVRIMVDADTSSRLSTGQEVLRQHYDGWHRWEEQTTSMEQVSV